MIDVRIENIEDVLPHIPEDAGMSVRKRDNYTVVDYAYVTDDTFSNEVALQCRGIKFDQKGRIIARPFHKFFNLGERERSEDIDWSRPHEVQEKLDGSMIHPALIDDVLVFMTRAGVTPHAENALRSAGPNVLEFCRTALEAGITPLFEHTSPDNRIVIAYDTNRLTLLAARETVEGRYLLREELEVLAERHDVPVVSTTGTVSDHKAFVSDARALEGAEGYVIVFEDGHRLKIKADAYVLRHKALSNAGLEKNVLAWVVEDIVDDVLPLLPDEAADRVLSYQQEVRDGLRRQADSVRAFVTTHRELPRKDFAVAANATLDKRLRGAAFGVLDGKDPEAILLKALQSATGSETRVEAIRDLYGMTWKGIDVDLEPS